MVNIIEFYWGKASLSNKENPSSCLKNEGLNYHFVCQMNNELFGPFLLSIKQSN